MNDVSRPIQSQIVPLESAFTDARGTIQPLVDGGFASAQAISCNTDSVRANHYHKEDWHYYYIASGSMNYYFRSVGATEDPSCIKVSAGQMIFTPPLEEHVMHFLEPSMLINFANRQRDQASYEDDLVRIPLIPVPGS